MRDNDSAVPSEHLICVRPDVKQKLVKRVKLGVVYQSDLRAAALSVRRGAEGTATHQSHDNRYPSRKAAEIVEMDEKVGMGWLVTLIARVTA